MTAWAWRAEIAPPPKTLVHHLPKALLDTLVQPGPIRRHQRKSREPPGVPRGRVTLPLTDRSTTGSVNLKRPLDALRIVGVDLARRRRIHCDQFTVHRRPAPRRRLLVDDPPNIRIGSG